MSKQQTITRTPQKEIRRLCHSVLQLVAFPNLYEGEWGDIAKDLETAREIAKQEQGRLIREGEA